jgi:hypothetical protein
METGELSANTAQEPTSLETVCTPMVATSELEPKKNVDPFHLGLLSPTLWIKPLKLPLTQWSELLAHPLSAELSSNGTAHNQMEAALNLSKLLSSRRTEVSHQQESLNTAPPILRPLNALFAPKSLDLHLTCSTLMMMLLPRSTFNTLHTLSLTRLTPMDTMLPSLAPSPRRSLPFPLLRLPTLQLMLNGLLLAMNQTFVTNLSGTMESVKVITLNTFL